MPACLLSELHIQHSAKSPKEFILCVNTTGLSNEQGYHSAGWCPINTDETASSLLTTHLGENHTPVKITSSVSLLLVSSCCLFLQHLGKKEREKERKKKKPNLSLCFHYSASINKKLLISNYFVCLWLSVGTQIIYKVAVLAHFLFSIITKDLGMLKPEKYVNMNKYDSDFTKRQRFVSQGLYKTYSLQKCLIPASG